MKMNAEVETRVATPLRLKDLSHMWDNKLFGRTIPWTMDNPAMRIKANAVPADK
jgi:hypothetical protein